MPGHASDGIVAGSTGWPMPSATIQYTTAVEVSMIAPIADTAAPSSASVPTRSLRSPDTRAARMIQIE